MLFLVDELLDLSGKDFAYSPFVDCFFLLVIVVELYERMQTMCS